MQALIGKYAAPGSYRWAAVLLSLVSIGLPLCISLSGGFDWLAFLSGLPAYIILIILTYHRLSDASLSGGWVILMIMAFNVGPSWDGPGPLHLYLSHLVILIPVVLGLITPSNFGANPKRV